MVTPRLPALRGPGFVQVKILAFSATLSSGAGLSVAEKAKILTCTKPGPLNAGSRGVTIPQSIQKGRAVAAGRDDCNMQAGKAAKSVPAVPGAA